MENIDNYFLLPNGKKDVKKISNFIDELVENAEMKHIVSQHSLISDESMLKRLKYEDIEIVGRFDSSFSENDLREMIKEAIYYQESIFTNWLLNGKDDKIVISCNLIEEDFSFEDKNMPNSLGESIVKGINDKPNDKTINCDTICFVCMKGKLSNHYKNLITADIITAYPVNEKYLSSKANKVQSLTSQDREKLKRIVEKQEKIALKQSYINRMY